VLDVKITDTPVGSIEAAAAASAFAKGAFRRRYVLGLMALVSASQTADRQLFSIAMEPLKHEFGFSDTQMGFLNGTVFGTAYALGVVPFAILADRWSRKKIIAFTLAFWSVMTAMTAAAGSYAVLVVTRTLVGLGEAGAGPAMLALLAKRYPPEKRAGMAAVITVATSLSAFAAFWSAGAVIERFGWKALFLIFGLPGLVLTAVIWWTVQDDGIADTKGPVGAMAKEVRRVLFCAPLLHLFAVAGWNGLIASGTQAWMSSYLIRSFHMPFSSVGFWMGLSAAMGGVVGAVLGGALSVIWSRRSPTGSLRLMLCAIAFSLPLNIGVFLAPSPELAIAALLAASAVLGMAGPPLAAQLLDLMPDAVRSTVMAIVSMGALFVAGLGPSLVGLLSDGLAARGRVDGLRDALLIVSVLGIMPIVHVVAMLLGRSRRAEVGVEG
jgi:MFS family permease